MKAIGNLVDIESEQGNEFNFQGYDMNPKVNSEFGASWNEFNQDFGNKKKDNFEEHGTNAKDNNFNYKF